MAIASLTTVLLIGLDGTVQFISTNGYLPTRFENEDRIPFSLPHANDVSMLPILIPIACMGIMSLPGVRLWQSDPSSCRWWYSR